MGREAVFMTNPDKFCSRKCKEELFRTPDMWVDQNKNANGAWCQSPQGRIKTLTNNLGKPIYTHTTYL